MSVLIEVLAKALNIGPDEVRNLVFKQSDEGALTEDFNEDAAEILTAKLSEHIAAVKKAAHDEGHKRGTQTSAKQTEKALRERLGLDSSLSGDALVSAVAERLEKAGENDENKIKASPLYLQLEKQMQERERQLIDEKEKAVNEILQRQEKEALTQKFRSNVFEQARALGVVLPQDQSKAERLLSVFFNAEFAEIVPQYGPNGEVLALTKPDGQRVEDSLGHALTLEKLLKEKASAYFEISQQPPTGSAGNKNTPPPPGQAPQNQYKGQVPQNEQEFNALYERLQGNPAERDEMVNAYLTSLKATA